MPAFKAVDGVRVPLSPVAIVNPHSDPAALFNNWDSIPTKSVFSANPAVSAASILVLTVPAGKRIKPIAIRQNYVRDANAANVYAYVRFTEADGFNVGAAACPNPMTASHTWEILMMIGQPALTFDDGAVWYTFGGMPDIEIRQGGAVTMYWANDTAGDDGGPVGLTYKEAPL